jgi:poly-gamma-glutamate synthesis protein (capsule biosynthesis protein)
MKKFLAYFFGGIACMAVGVGIFIAIGTYFHPAPSRLPFARQMSATDAVNELLPLVGKSLAGRVKAAVVSAPAQTPVAKPTTVFFGGDIMIGRSVAEAIAKNGNEYPFVNIKDTVSSADYAMANLEGPITTVNNAPANRMRFHFDPSMTAALSMTGFDAFSLANNHGLDQGAQGFADTKKNLTDNNVAFFGDASDDDGPVLRFAIGHEQFAVIGAQDVYRQIDPVALGKKIKAEKDAGNFVIVYPHWGVEYNHAASTRQTKLAYAFIDAGADIVVGSHPHVVEGIEIYKGKPIFYSLGNLVFDQYFSADTQEGLGLRLNIDAAGSTSVDLLPYEIPQSQPVLAVGDQRTKLLEALASYSSPSLKDQIIAGNIKF